MLNLISTLRQQRQKPVPLTVPGKVGMLDICTKCFPPQGEAGIWGFAVACSVLSWGVGGYGKCLYASLNYYCLCSQWPPGIQSMSGLISALRQVRQKPGLWAAPRKVGLLDVWSSSFSPRRKAGICLLCTKLGSGCCCECLCDRPNRLCSPQPSGIQTMLNPVSTTRQARQKPVLRVAPQNWNVRHMVQFIKCLLKKVSWLVSRFFTKGIVLCVVDESVCPWAGFLFHHLADITLLISFLFENQVLQPSTCLS